MGSSTALTTKATSGTPYQLDKSQVSRASEALLRHIKTTQAEKEKNATKKTLIGDNDEDSDGEQTVKNEAVWLVLTTKKHVVDKNRLKPGKIPIPHSLNTKSSLSVCLITADPQRAVKNIVADPSFPAHLTNSIDKVIGYNKLKARYDSFEKCRQLLAEHDVFLADDRIIMRLVQTLGKTFYKSSKRPIPVRIAAIEKVDGKRVKKDAKAKKSKDEGSAFAAPEIVAREIERALHCAPVQLAPATTAAIRVGASNFTAEQLAENIDAVVTGLTEKYVTKGWRNLKAIHIKGANTMAMPIWLASELWLEDDDVVEEGTEEVAKTVAGGKKRKQISAGDEEKQQQIEAPKKAKKAKAAAEDDEDAVTLAARKEKLQKQKAKALEDGAAPTKAEAGAGKKKRKSTS
ncbi:uncharacterized protein BO72DRAFT_422087 [Aspergillus fijiensis CBS 313.89]|uniref:Ribosomal protein L1 n=1 Tax=Aspergillus fijiensis CBS 313.89 TaxID=1448319 RepID=A0A8G1RXZ8_9EURO|nr:ribosomal protein L1 [Aspergillus fijiensis CBS 313.89]RAK80939.1 ribosomal protein L1 [Aspergillus fijiensis CBS 313.89]